MSSSTAQQLAEIVRSIFGKSAAGTTIAIIYYLGLQLRESEYSVVFSLAFIAAISYVLNRNSAEKQSLEQKLLKMQEDVTNIATSSQIELDKAKTTIDLFRTVIQSMGDEDTRELVKIIMESMDKLTKK